MKALVLIFALFLTACSNKAAEPIIPEELLRVEPVRCKAGNTERHLGQCAIALRAGLDLAHGKLRSIAEIVASPR